VDLPSPEDAPLCPPQPPYSGHARTATTTGSPPSATPYEKGRDGDLAIGDLAIVRGYNAAEALMPAPAGYGYRPPEHPRLPTRRLSATPPRCRSYVYISATARF
jgi:hypothetical protein